MELKNPETTILDHQELYHGKIVRLHVDTIQLPSGGTAIREIVHHPGGVVAVPVLDDGRLVLVRQFRYPLGKFILEFPAGKLDGELSPLEAIARELNEEIGYQAEVLSHEFSFYTSPGYCTEIIHLYIARGLRPVPQRLEEGEHITVAAYGLDECLDKIQTGEIVDGKTLLGLLWYRLKFGMK